MLSSLVLNPPYKVDGFSTSPKIEKIINLPLGIRITSAALLRRAFRVIVSMSILMTVSSLLISSVYLPLESKNTELLKNIKQSTSQKLNLLATVNESSSFSTLFSNAERLSFEDTEEVININPSNTAENKASQLISFNKYPQIEFAGF